MAWKNPEDRKAWTSRYNSINRDKLLVWRDNARNKEREKNKDATEKRQLAKTKRDQENLLKEVSGAINEIRTRIMQRDGLCKCSTCGEVKPYKSMIRRDGKRKLTGLCRKCAGFPDTRYRAKSYTCKRCKRSLPVDMFDRYDSNGLHKSCCKECYKTNKERSEEKHALYIAQKSDMIKKGLLECSRCKQVKKLSEFPKSARNVESISRTCSKCSSQTTIMAYYKKTPEERRKSANSSWKNMMRDPEVKLKYSLRKRLTTAMHRVLKGKPYSSYYVLEFIGCSPEELRNYLEAQFKIGMTWENHGKKWEIDHVFPLCNFDLTNHDDMRKAWHYTNLRPLWKIDNRRKHAKVIGQHQPLLIALT